MKNETEQPKRTRQPRRTRHRRAMQTAMAELMRGLPRWATLMARQAMRRGPRSSKTTGGTELPCNQLHYHAD